MRGGDIPQGSRLIAIVEAFDAMTTDHVYRPARSQERAIAELYEAAGAQFDPELVAQFADFLLADASTVHRAVAEHWLKSLDPGAPSLFWGPRAATECAVAPDATHDLFEAKLLNNMHDAVMFIDAAGRITHWNRGAERLTAISSGSVCGQLWHPELLHLADEKSREIHEADCPVYSALRSGVQSLRRLSVFGRTGRKVAVDAHSMPVIDAQGTTHGAILLFHDASSETSLEQRCQALYEKSTKDPLTQVANRAEFDRVHELFVEAHRRQNTPCSLLICDLDRFKQVNDTYGHQAGDEAIKSLAALLRGSCRPGDLVARYGGEEFVMLCADCGNAQHAFDRCELAAQRLQPGPQRGVRDQ